MASKVPSVEHKPGTVGLKQAAEILGLSLQRTRTLTINGKIPGAEKNEKGWWRYDEATLSDFAQNRPTRVSGDGMVTYKVRCTPEMAAQISETTGLEFKRAYKPKPKKDKENVPAKKN